MKKNFFIILFLLSFFSNAQMKEHNLNWMTDFVTAKKIAKQDNKPILLLFTGSDWCPPCRAMHKDLFSNKDFVELSKKFVLVYVDFPKRKKLSDEQREHNYKLASKFHRGGVPTMVFITPEEKVITKSTGYRFGHPENKIEVLKKVLKLFK